MITTTKTDAAKHESIWNSRPPFLVTPKLGYVHNKTVILVVSMGDDTFGGIILASDYQEIGKIILGANQGWFKDSYVEYTGEITIKNKTS